MTTKLILLPLLAATTLSCGGNKLEADATGTFEAVEILVSSEITGKILRLEAEEGQRVEAGAPLGMIDTLQLSLERKQLEASLAAVTSRRADITKQLAATEQQLTAAKTERERFAQLARANAAGSKQVDDIDAQIALLNRQRDAQKSTLEEHNRSVAAEAASIAAKIEQVIDRSRRCHIASPITGTILVRYAEPGEIAVAGKPLFLLADTDQIFLRAYIPAALLSRVKLGQSARLLSERAASDPPREYAGRVTWISERAEFTPKGIQTRDERANQVYAVKIATRNDGWLRIGMYGEVIFAVE
ncbi:MAG: efflux RND transporter periplasmic adaptor subunit [Odoribacteraceae bacterium]|jgi:HlyD family secretion protein|nr:efflux RND transporter periplasmic adaptor subunit [Odoribacteraceae bacterium]